MAEPDAGDVAATASKLMSMITGGWVTQAMSVAAELKIPDLLADGAMTSKELAHATGAHASSLYRLMRALVTFEILRQRADGAFEVTPMGSMLSSNAEHSLRSWAIHCARRLSQDWTALLDSVKTGESARKLLTGNSMFEDLERDPEQAAAFNQAMVELTRLAADGIVHAYDFSVMKRIVDVGGGYGQLLAEILKANPEARGTVFDLPHAAEKGRRYLAEIGLAERCEFVPGNFFESVPGGADGYMLKSVMHNWSDERAQVILQCCRRAMAGRAKLLVIDRIMPLRLDSSAAHRAIALMDLNMLVVLEARERTEEEFRALLSSAGFRVTRILPATPTLSIIEAAPSSSSG
jgi:orsellinic acid C2-O-methyltransferase